MKKFGVLKDKILKKLSESYQEKNKKEIKEIFNNIKKDKSFKDMYLFYEDFENKYFEDKETAKLYVESVSDYLKKETKNLQKAIDTLHKKVGNLEVSKNELYENIDTLCEEDNLNNIDKKILAKIKLVEFLTTKKQEKIQENVSLVNNQSLLNAILTNNFNVLYDNRLNENEKNELKNVLSLSENEIVKKTTDLKNNILNKITNLLKESNDKDLKNKLETVAEEVNKTQPSRYNYFKLKELELGII